MPRMQVEIIFRFSSFIRLFIFFFVQKSLLLQCFLQISKHKSVQKINCKEIAKKHFLLLLFSLKHEDQLNRVDPSNPSKAIQAEDSAS